MTVLLAKGGDDIGPVVASDEFLALLDLFHGDRKTGFCKSFLKVRARFCHAVVVSVCPLVFLVFVPTDVRWPRALYGRPRRHSFVS